MSTQLNQIHKCNICGNIIEIAHTGANSLVCCGQPMQLIKENTKENEGNEKHVPIIEKNQEGVIVKVSSIEHPMTKEHHIEWIEILTSKGNSKKFLKPGEKPQAVFPVKTDISDIKAKCYCNLHRLWISK